MSAKQLILNKTSVSRFAGRQDVDAHVTLVYATADNELLAAERPLNRRESALKPPRWRYDVDASNLYASFSDNLLTARPPYAFAADITAGFRVHNAREIVRRQINDAEPLVRGHLLAGLRTIARRYEMDDFNAAQEAMANLFTAPVVMFEGLTIFACQVLLKARETDFATRIQVDKEFGRGQIEEVRQTISETSAISDARIEEIKARNQIKITGLERESASAIDTSDDGLTRAIVANSPDGAMEIMRMRRESDAEIYRRTREANQEELDRIAFLDDRGLIPPTARPRIMTQIIPPTVDQSALPSSTRPSALPAGLAGVATDAAAPAPADVAATSVPSTPPPAVRVPQAQAAAEPPSIDLRLPQPPGAAAPSATSPVEPETPPVRTSPIPPVSGPALVQPIYLLVDESPGAAAHLPIVNSGITDLVTTLVKQGGATSALRLSIIGVGETARVVHGLSEVALMDTPALYARGQARYGLAFDELDRLIPDDVGNLKTAGHRVSRPLVFLLSLTSPSESDDWRPAHQRLTDQDRLRAAPHVAAFGIGSVDPIFIRRVATRAEFAFISPSDAGTNAAIRAFVDSLRFSLIPLATGDLKVEHPIGFKSANEEV